MLSPLIELFFILLFTLGRCWNKTRDFGGEKEFPTKLPWHLAQVKGNLVLWEWKNNSWLLTQQWETSCPCPLFINNCSNGLVQVLETWLLGLLNMLKLLCLPVHLPKWIHINLQEQYIPLFMTGTSPIIFSLGVERFRKGVGRGVISVKWDSRLKVWAKLHMCLHSHPAAIILCSLWSQAGTPSKLLGVQMRIWCRGGKPTAVKDKFFGLQGSGRHGQRQKSNGCESCLPAAQKSEASAPTTNLTSKRRYHSSMTHSNQVKTFKENAKEKDQGLWGQWGV